MSVNWNDSTSKARVYALAAAEASGEFDKTVKTWDIYCDLRYALTWALLITGFPPKSDWGITEKNWEKVYKRLYVLEQVNGCYRVYNNGSHASREMYFTPEEVKSMIGFSVNAGTKTDAEFKTYIYQRLSADATSKLDDYFHPPESNKDNPYWQEQRYAPTLVKEMQQ
jgi:hypothetical protein